MSRNSSTASSLGSLSQALGRLRPFVHDGASLRHTGGHSRGLLDLRDLQTILLHGDLLSRTPLPDRRSVSCAVGSLPPDTRVSDALTTVALTVATRPTTGTTFHDTSVEPEGLTSRVRDGAAEVASITPTPSYHSCESTASRPSR